MAEKVSRHRGYRSDTIAISRDMGPLRSAMDLHPLRAAPSPGVLSLSSMRRLRVKTYVGGLLLDSLILLAGSGAR